MKGRSGKPRKRSPRGAASKTHPKRIAAYLKHVKALELRLAGKSFDYIAKKLGYGYARSAHLAVEAALEKVIQEPASKLLAMERERLDRLLSAIWSTAEGGDLEAIDRCLKIMDRRAKYHGLDYWELHEKQKLLEERLFGHADNRGHQVESANDGAGGEGTGQDRNGQQEAPNADQIS